jgi:hypothetical protein
VAPRRLKLRRLKRRQRLPKLHLHRKRLRRLPSPHLRRQNLLLQSQRRLRQSPRLLNDEFVISKIMKKPGSARLFC